MDVLLPSELLLWAAALAFPVLLVVLLLSARRERRRRDGENRVTFPEENDPEP